MNYILDCESFVFEGVKLGLVVMIDYLVFEYVMLVEFLKVVGYVIGFFGKWYLVG